MRFATQIGRRLLRIQTGRMRWFREVFVISYVSQFAGNRLQKVCQTRKMRTAR